jgi:type I restriction enzyme, S subunit
MSTIKTLGDVCESIVYGVTASAVATNDGPRFLRITDITEDGVDWKRVPGCRISPQAHLGSSLADGDIVVARTGGTVGKSFLVSQPPDAVCASYLLRLRLNRAAVLPEYVQLFMQCAAYWKQLMEAAQGAAQPNVNGTTLAAIELPVPLKDEQKVIVRRAQGVLTTARAAQQAVRKQHSELQTLANSVLAYSVLNGRFKPSRLEHVLSEVKEGVGSEWSGLPVLGATRSGLAPAKEPPGKHAERYKPVTIGTVFYNPMRVLIGSIAFVDDDDEPGITSPDYVVLKGKPGVVDSRWFYYWLRSPLGERCIQSLARGAVRERMLFNRLAEGEIELPDYDTQVKTSKALAQIKPMRAAILKQSAELELMPQKLLAQVFES